MPKLFFWLSKVSSLCPLTLATRGNARKTMLAVAIFLFFFSSIASANKLSVTHAKLVNQDSGANTVAIKFDVSWENSWRDVTNYDAVWVFTKYCTSNCSTSGTWAHATMKTAGTNPSGVSQGSGTGLDVIVSADKKGAFLQRSANGTGTATTTNVELVWDYNADILPNTVEVYMKYLRQKIDDPFKTHLIHTIRGFGYKIEAK